MTNEMIIFLKRVELMEKGIIGKTGRFVEIETENGLKRFEEPEEIHTYKRWQELGYQVKKGETSSIKFKVWFYSGKNAEMVTDQETEKASKSGKCYMRMTSFFTIKQVKVQDKEEKKIA